MSPKKCPRNVTQKEDFSWTKVSTKCHQKCPQEVTPFVHENSPIMSTRCLPPKCTLEFFKILSYLKCTLGFLRGSLILEAFNVPFTVSPSIGLHDGSLEIE
jgi:hypothetical protein